MDNQTNNLLLKTPHLSEKISIEKKEEILFIKYKRNSLFEKILTFIFNAPQTIYVELDSKSSEVIKYIDGKRTFWEIYKILNKKKERQKQ